MTDTDASNFLFSNSFSSLESRVQQLWLTARLYGFTEHIQYITRTSPHIASYSTKVGEKPQAKGDTIQPLMTGVANLNCVSEGDHRRSNVHFDIGANRYTLNDKLRK
jgi:hypothetical protein